MVACADANKTGCNFPYKVHPGWKVYQRAAANPRDSLHTQPGFQGIRTRVVSSLAAPFCALGPLLAALRVHVVAGQGRTRPRAATHGGRSNASGTCATRPSCSRGAPPYPSQTDAVPGQPSADRLRCELAIVRSITCPWYNSVGLSNSQGWRRAPAPRKRGSSTTRKIPPCTALEHGRKLAIERVPLCSDLGERFSAKARDFC